MIDSGDRGRPTSRTRREAAREALGQSNRAPLLEALADPRWHMGLPALLVATAIVAFMVLLGQSRPEVVPGRIAHQTVTVPKAVTFVDEAESQRAVENELAVLDRPMIPDDAWLARLQEDLVAVGSAIRASEASTPEPERTALAQISEATWNRQVKRLIEEYLLEIPLVDNDLDAEASARGRLLVRLSSGRVVRPTTIIRIDQNPKASDLTNAILRAGLPEEAVAPLAREIIGPNAQPTITLDRDRRAQLELQARDQTPQVVEQYEAGQILWRAGQRVPAEQLDDAKKIYAETAHLGWSEFGTAFLLCLLVMAPLAGFSAHRHPKITRHAIRLATFLSLLIGLLAIPFLLGERLPAVRDAAVIAIAAFGTISVSLAYDRMLGGVAGGTLGVLGALVAPAPIMLAPGVVAGAAVMAARLGNFEDRATILSAAGRSAVVFALGAAVAEWTSLPSGTEGLFGQGAARAFAAWLTTLLIGFLAMGLLPTMERWFDRVTGMTLAELRDPRHPLLQELAARAPGTYDHSLQVASLVEAGVSAIGGDAALAYVGALYHDIGKMRKPEYFVENQSGENPHDELRPNISYLIIAGHVKDGLEMAAASGLPKSLREFISSHHGTQVVRWFYVKARDAASEDEEVEEASFRYPGPRPRSQEAAGLMLADACESASRAAVELPSGKIESIVRDLSKERLLDGQFDECKLTLRELHEIEDAIIGRLRSIRHQRLAYPDDQDEAASPESSS